jgi:hypothetical protein
VTVIGYGRSDYTDESLQKKIGKNIDGTDKEKESFLKTVCCLKRCTDIDYAGLDHSFALPWW